MLHPVLAMRVALKIVLQQEGAVLLLVLVPKALPRRLEHGPDAPGVQRGGIDLPGPHPGLVLTDVEQPG